MAHRTMVHIIMGKMSRSKGARAERQAAAFLNEHLGTAFHRGRQYHGGPDSKDIMGDMEGVHIEVKHVEHLNLRAALQQAIEDASPTQVPVVMHKKNNKPWLITLRGEDLIRFLDAVNEVTERWNDGDSVGGLSGGVAEETAGQAE